MTRTTLSDPTALPEGTAPQPSSWARPARASRRAKRPVVWAVSLGLLGSAAITSSVAASSDSAERTPAVTASRPAPTDAMATAAPVPVTGVAENGTAFNGTFTLDRFIDKQGVLYAVGRLEGTLGARDVQKNVRMPVTGASNTLPGEGFAGGSFAPQQVDPTPGACDILTLTLGPLDLDLLGLRVALDTVNLLIEAIPGGGNLLGNLLCAVAGLLDGGLLGGLLNNLLASITALLNGLLGL